MVILGNDLYMECSMPPTIRDVKRQEKNGCPRKYLMVVRKKDLMVVRKKDVWQDHPELKVPAQAQCRTLFTVFVWQIHIKCKIVQHICIGVQPELYRLHKRLWYCFVLSCYRLRIILGWTSDRKFKNNCWPSKGTHPGKKNVFFRALPDLPPPLPLRLGDDHP